jgi:pimeloyl-ACP methyl ester carboxylesterase
VSRGGAGAPGERRALPRAATRAALLLAGLAFAAACTKPIDEAVPVHASGTGVDEGTAASVAAGSNGSSSSGGPTSSTVAPAVGAHFESGDCRFERPEGYTVRCGYLVTEQDREHPDGTFLRLHVGIFHKDGATVAPDPILYLDGGPGGNALQGATTDFDHRFGGFAAERDVIVFDQRGTGYSEPNLDCPALTELVYDQLDETSPNASQVEAQQRVLADCRDDLVDEGVDPSRYNSVASAADVADLRVALGYDRWNLLGVSYGTRLAQTVLRTHPEGVRSVILDSVYPTASDSLVELPGQMQAAFDHFFAACRSDPACDGRYPNLQARFATLVDRLQRKPETLTATDYVSGDEHTVVVTGSDLQDVLFQSLYDPSMFTAMPQLVEDLEAGRSESLTTMESVAVTQLPFLTMNVYVSVQCHEEVAFADPAEVQQEAAAHPALAEPLAGQLIDSTAGFRTCQVWDAGVAPPEEDQPVSSDVPALVLSGGFDPITPTAGAREVARTLSRSTFVELPSQGHGVTLEPGCPQDIARSFVAAPEATPGTSCVASIPPPHFAGADPSSDIPLEAFEEDTGGTTVSGVRPDSWLPVGPGAVARQRNVVDQTALVQQGAKDLRPDDLVGVLAQQLPLDGGFSPAESTAAGGLTWSRYRAELGGDHVDLAVAERDGVSFMALLVSEPDERDQLVATVLEPALGELRAA